MGKIYLSFNPLVRLRNTRNGYNVAITPQGVVYRYNHETRLPLVLANGKRFGGPFDHLSFAIPSVSSEILKAAESWTPEQKENQGRRLAQWRYVGSVCKRSLRLIDGTAQFSDRAERPIVTEWAMEQLTETEQANVVRAINGLPSAERPACVAGYWFDSECKAFVPA